MQARIFRFVAPLLLAVTLPATAVLAQTQTQPPAHPEPKTERQKESRRERLSPEARARLLDGRMAMIKESLKLDANQLKLWTPVEQQIRVGSTSREQRRAERREQREQGAARPSMAERLDRASQRMTERAERLKALNDAFKPFYASLSDEQKAVAGVVLREARGGHGRGMGHRWARRAQGERQQQDQR